MSLYPKDYVSSTYEIDFAKLRELGYKGILFDVDNTLVPHGAPADERAIQLFTWLHELGFSVTILSNNKEPRVKTFCEAVKWADYIYKAGKPKPENYRLAMERMECDNTNTIFIGDQIFTDIWGANNAGIRSVLVKPILPWKEEPQIILKRFLEAIVLATYKLANKKSDLPLLEGERKR